eukprot:contig_4604_g993
MISEIARELDNKYILEVTDPREVAQLVCVSSAFVANTANKPRAVLDYKHQIGFIDTASCKYETMPELAQTLRPQDAHLFWDIKDAYHHLMVRPEDRKYLAFCCLGRFFVPITMPFGLAPAAMIWTNVMRLVVQHLRELGFRMMAYVDDFGGAPPAPPGQPARRAQAIAAYHLVERLFCELKLRMHPTKGERDGPTQVHLLGHLRWALLTRRVVNPLVADLPDPDAAARLVLKGYRPNTQRSYMSKCRGFFSYCKQYDRDPLPASMPTVMGYVLYELENGALAPPSLAKYLSAVASLHLLAGHPDHTKDKLVQLAVFGFRATALERAGGELERQWMPLPADYILRVCNLGLSTPNAYLSLQCAGLAL